MNNKIENLSLFLKNKGLHKEAAELDKIAYYTFAIPAWEILKFVGAAAVTTIAGFAGWGAYELYGSHSNLYRRCGADPDGTANEALAAFMEYVMKQDVVNGFGTFPVGSPPSRQLRLRKIIIMAFQTKTPADITASWVQERWADARGSYILNFDDEDYYANTLAAIIDHKDAEKAFAEVIGKASDSFSSSAGREPKEFEVQQMVDLIHVEGLPPDEAGLKVAAKIK